MAEDNKPTHRLVLMSDRPTSNGREIKTTYTEICALWPTRSGSGGVSGQIPEGMALSGRILVQPITGKDDQPNTTEGAAASHLSDQ